MTAERGSDIPFVIDMNRLTMLPQIGNLRVPGELYNLPFIVPGIVKEGEIRIYPDSQKRPPDNNLITVNFEAICPEIAESVQVMLYLNIGLPSRASYTAIKSLTDGQLYEGRDQTSEVLCHEWMRLDKTFTYFKVSPLAYKYIGVKIWR